MWSDFNNYFVSSRSRKTMQKIIINYHRDLISYSFRSTLKIGQFNFISLEQCYSI